MEWKLVMGNKYRRMREKRTSGEYNAIDKIRIKNGKPKTKFYANDGDEKTNYIVLVNIYSLNDIFQLTGTHLLCAGGDTVDSSRLV